MAKFIQFVLPNGEGDLYVKKSAIQEIKDTGEVDPELGWCISQVILTDGRRHSVVGPANCLFLYTFESPIKRWKRYIYVKKEKSARIRKSKD